jgi:hypothetical protein
MARKHGKHAMVHEKQGPFIKKVANSAKKNRKGGRK